MFSVSNYKVSNDLPRVPAARLVGHDGPIQAVRFVTASGKYCVTGGYDRTVRLWNPARLDPAYPPPPTAATVGPVNHSFGSVDPFSHYYYQDDDNNNNHSASAVPLESLPRALCIQTYTDGLTHPVSAVAVSDESTDASSSSSSSSSAILIAASDRTLVVMDLVTKRALRRLSGHYGRINAVAIGPGQETYLSASYDATVRIWDGRSRSTEPIQLLPEAKDSVTDIHLARQGNDNLQRPTMIRTSSVDGVVRTYDLRKGLVTCDDYHSPITGMAPTHDGKCLAVSCLDGSIRLMELETGELLNTYLDHHVAGQYGLNCGVTANDTTIVSASEDGSAVMYDLVRATCVQSLRGHTKAVCSVAAHPLEPSVLVTASYDASAVVWAKDYHYVRWQE